MNDSCSVRRRRARAAQISSDRVRFNRSASKLMDLQAFGTCNLTVDSEKQKITSVNSPGLIVNPEVEVSSGFAHNSSRATQNQKT